MDFILILDNCLEFFSRKVCKINNEYLEKYYLLTNYIFQNLRKGFSLNLARLLDGLALNSGMLPPRNFLCPTLGLQLCAATSGILRYQILPLVCIAGTLAPPQLLF